MDDHAQPLKILLFIRSAWSLENLAIDVPALDPVPAPGASALPASATRDVCAQRWNEQWQRIWDWYGAKGIQPAHLSQQDMQRLSQPGQDLAPDLPPFWTTEYGTNGIDVDAFGEWDRITLPELKPSRQSHKSTVAMAAAWERGLRDIIVLPYQGHYAAWSRPGQLVVSIPTRRTPDLFTAALKLPL